jgi:hypothetical protein
MQRKRLKNWKRNNNKLNDEKINNTALFFYKHQHLELNFC